LTTDSSGIGNGHKATGTIRMYTTSWCPDCYRAKRFLKERGLPFDEINIEQADGAEDFVMSVNQGRRRVPTFEVDGRTFHCSPYDPHKLLRELGLEETVSQ
jgi:mycoredoxin